MWRWHWWGVFLVLEWKLRWDTGNASGCSAQLQAALYIALRNPGSDSANYGNWKLNYIITRSEHISQLFVQLISLGKVVMSSWTQLNIMLSVCENHILVILWAQLLYLSVCCGQFSVNWVIWKAQISVPTWPYLTFSATSNSVTSIYKFCYNEYLCFKSHRCIKS